MTVADMPIVLILPTEQVPIPCQCTHLPKRPLVQGLHAYSHAGAEASEAHLRKSACKERVPDVAIRTGI